MDSQIVEFFYDAEIIEIYCSENETMKNIIEKFCNKIPVDKNSICCLYGGKKLDENNKLEDLIKLKNDDEKIKILVYPMNKQGEEEIQQIVKSSNIICPECKDMALIELNNYKISINCKKNHNVRNI